jgi:hypothetical protein
MAVIPPNTAINRILAALGLDNVRSLKINAAVNSAVAVVTEQYVTGTQMDDLATALETKEWVLVPKDAGRWIAVEDQWPRHGSDVLVAYKAGQYVLLGVGEFDGTTVNDDGVTVPYFKGIGGFEVTHWMPLPEPPAECP